MTNPVDQQAMAECERRDFGVAESVLRRAFSYADIVFTPAPLHSHYDAVLEVCGVRWLVELKWRDQPLSYGTFPILRRKYWALLTEADAMGCGCLYVVLNRGYAYVYDLRRIDLRDCIVRPWHIRKYQLSEDDSVEAQMTVFMPFRLCVGVYPFAGA